MLFFGNPRDFAELELADPVAFLDFLREEEGTVFGADLWGVFGGGNGEGFEGVFWDNGRELQGTQHTSVVDVSINDRWRNWRRL